MRPDSTFAFVVISLSCAARAFAGDTLARGQTAVVSIDTSSGTSGSGLECGVSSSARFVVFVGFANLAGVPSNGKTQILLRDRKKGKVTVVSRGASGIADNYCSEPAISSNGRWIVFKSAAGNLDGAGNGKQQVFRHDRKTGELRRVSIGPSTAPSNENCTAACVSKDGRLIAFLSEATNLSIPATTGLRHAWIRNVKEGATELVSVATGGVPADGSCSELSMSSNGRFVAFTCSAKNLGDGDTTFSTDPFVRDRKTGVTRVIAVRTNGENSQGTTFGVRISANGRFVAYYSSASDLTAQDPSPVPDLFVEDLKTGKIEGFGIFSQGEWTPCSQTAISRNGSRLAATMWHQNDPLDLFDDTTEVFVIRRASGVVTRASVNSAGDASNGDENRFPALAGAGNYIVFASNATNLGADHDSAVDVFIRRL